MKKSKPSGRVTRKSLSKDRTFANDNIADELSPHELANMESKLEQQLGEVLDTLKIDWRIDHNTQGTPRRIAKMWLRELFAGRYEPAPKLTDFPNDKNYDGLLMVGPIKVNSTCSHHFVEFSGHAYVGVLPGDRVIGLSKYARIVDWFCRRPQIQEEMTQQIADFLYQKIKPRGIAVYVCAKHHCMTIRGVMENADTVTSVVLGQMRTDPNLKQEFFKLIKLSEGRRVD